MDHRPKVRGKTTNLLEENRGEPFCDTGIGKDVLNRTKKALMIKENKL